MVGLKTGCFECCFPAGLLADVQRKLVEFFWSGQHWLKAAVLYLPTHEGGQGLMDLESRVAAFRLKAVQRLLYHPDLPWRETAHVLLWKAGNKGLDRHLFLLDTTGLALSGLESFYASMLSTWTLLQQTRMGGPQPTPWVWEEPIFCNKLIPLRSVLSTALRRRFLNAGLCKVGCLRMSDSTGWKTTGVLSQQTGIATQRLLGRVLDEFSAQQSSSLFRPRWEELKSLMALGTKDLLSLSVEQLCDSSLPLNLLLLSMMMVCSGCPSSSIIHSSLCSVLLSATFTTESSSTPTTDPARLTSLSRRISSLFLMLPPQHTTA
ncbi:hypothetical protein NFI96_025912 [Prochilodus magdalenae]|nr:hypothetical protein NFI96_025912 [Prochilodus magdalenae]